MSFLNIQTINNSKFVKLSWLILYHKCLYYEITDTEYDHLRISDKKFDKLVKRYRKLAKKLSLAPTADNMIGFDLSRPSCMSAMSKVLLDHYFYNKHKKE